uniref:Auxin-responsive protein SAUR71 n=1 Tax=Aegilops tauschii subsp. strangulata TaxID=200361 RepID=A0A453CQH0_AEGTS
KGKAPSRVRDDEEGGSAAVRVDGGVQGGAGGRGGDGHLSPTASGKVPAGHVPVEVGAEGEETERFLVPAELLGRPPIAELLRRAAQEYGYARRGPLRIPCPVAAFRRLLSALAGGDRGHTPVYYAVVV